MKIEINKEQKEGVIDWDKPQLFISEDVIVLSTGEHSEDSFTGITISDSEYYKFGSCAISWVKDEFEPFKGSITLSNY